MIDERPDESRERSPKLVLHLVHGTWPFGLLRKKSRRSRAAWFEQSSAVRQRIEQAAGSPFKTEIFSWSGRNSFNARARAADELAAHLNEAKEREPGAHHVVLAHSHGGTIALQALGRPASSIPDIDALICLSTPFVYAIPATRFQRELFAISIGSIATALLFAIALTLFGLSYDFIPGLLIPLVALFPTLLFAVPFDARRDAQSPVRGGVPLAEGASVPIVCIRSSRDEASLALGLAQAVHSISTFFSAEGQNVGRPGARSMSAHTFPALLPSIYAGWSIFLQLSGATEASLWQQVGWAFVFGSACAGALYLGAYAALAWTLGFRDVRQWLRWLPDVDMAPPDMACTVKSYSSLRTAPGSLRHGTYEDEMVIADIGRLLKMLPAGERPVATALKGQGSTDGS